MSNLIGYLQCAYMMRTHVSENIRTGSFVLIYAGKKYKLSRQGMIRTYMKSEEENVFGKFERKIVA